MERAKLHYADQAKLARLELFLKRLLHPEDFGLSVTAEVRDEARRLLGMPMVETGKAK